MDLCPCQRACSSSHMGGFQSLLIKELPIILLPLLLTPLDRLMMTSLLRAFYQMYPYLL